MRAHGRPILAAFAGLIFGLSLDLGLLVWGVLTLSSKALVVIPPAAVVVGIAWAFWSPLGTRPVPPVPPATPVSPVPPEVTPT